MTTHKIQIDDQIREATADEAARIEAAQAEAQAQAKADETKAAAKANALAKLGLTADEVAVLFG